MKHLQGSSQHQKGSSLIESLIALTILLFAVLGLIGLQTEMLRISGQSKYRVEATLLAQNLMGLMSINTKYADCYATSGGGACGSDDATAQMEKWTAEVKNTLPNATSSEVTSAMPNHQNPSVEMDKDTKKAIITLGWKGPTDSAVRNLKIVGQPW